MSKTWMSETEADFVKATPNRSRHRQMILSIAK